MHTLVISDLHLTPQRPNTIAAFFNFLQQQAPKADALYILGDLFEFWIGDDAVDFLGAGQVINIMKATSETIPCYFITGNRDFLAGDVFTEQTGFQILPDETVVELYGKSFLLLHGDSLCTDDVAHQQFRQHYMTNKAFHQQFMQLTIEQRIEQAQQARMQSAEHKDTLTMEIMDVNEQAVLEAFQKHQVKNMIHGHTHRQDTHQYKLAENTEDTNGVRYVLGEWHKTASILTISPDSVSISNPSIPTAS